MSVVRAQSPSDVAHFWLAARPFLAEALANSENLMSLHDIYGRCMRHECDFWVAMQGEDLVGAFVTETLENVKGKYLHVPFCGTTRSLRVIRAIDKKITETAKLYGYCAVSFLGANPAWEGIAKRNGYRPRFMEYVKEL